MRCYCDHTDERESGPALLALALVLPVGLSLGVMGVGLHPVLLQDRYHEMIVCF